MVNEIRIFDTCPAINAKKIESCPSWSESYCMLHVKEVLF